MRVEFYLSDAMEALHFGPIAHELIAMGVDAAFVSNRSEAHNAAAGWYNPDIAEELLAKLRLPCVPAADPGADIALTTGATRILRDYRKLRARLNYGVSLVWYYIPRARRSHFAGFDLYLLHGEFDLAIFRKYVDTERVRMMGYPRYDAWFNNRPERATIRAKYNLEGEKPSLLYLPTWQHRSSIDRFADSIFMLSQDFEVLVKPHHCTYRMEKDRMQKLRNGPVTLLDRYMPPEDAFALADMVISDLDSGALTDAILLNKKLVALGDSGQVARLLLPDVKKVLPICVTPTDVVDRVHKIFAQTEISSGMVKIRGHMFDTTEGRDAQRAARAIVECVERNRGRHWSRVRTGLRWRKEKLRRHVGRVARRYGLLKQNR